MVKKSRFDVVVIGPPSVDIVFGDLAHWPMLGQEMYVDNFAIGVGATYNVAASLSRLGLRVALLCEVGNDFFSRYILSEFDRVGITRDLVITRNQPWFELSVCLAYEGERGFVSHISKRKEKASSADEIVPQSEAAEDWIYEALPLLAEYDFDAVFMHARPANLPLLNVANRPDTRIFFDTGWDPDVLSHALMPVLIKRGHFIVSNELEATFLTGTATAEEAVRKLAGWAPTAIVTMAENGAIAYQQGQRAYSPAIPVEKVVDATGAGDAFNSGLIYGILKGYPITEALRCGAICGALATTALTGTAAAPTSEELELLLRA
jgi:sugar/nucleoside kinase (ribokinase family)